MRHDYEPIHIYDWEPNGFICIWDEQKWKKDRNCSMPTDKREGERTLASVTMYLCGDHGNQCVCSIQSFIWISDFFISIACVDASGKDRESNRQRKDATRLREVSWLSKINDWNCQREREWRRERARWIQKIIAFYTSMISNILRIWHVVIPLA